MAGDQDQVEDNPELDLDEPAPEPEPEPEPEPGEETEPEPIAASPDEPEPQPEPQPRQPSRGESRFQRQQNENIRLNSELAETRRRLDELSRQMAEARKPQAETPEQRAARFALMTPQEQMQESLREAEQRHEVRMNQMQMQLAEQTDRMAFSAKGASDSLYAKWGPKVEGKLAEMRAQGQNASREVVLKFLIGEAALERRASREGRREVTQAAERVRRATTRPANSGSDTQATRRSGTQSLERRLENQQI